MSCCIRESELAKYQVKGRRRSKTTACTVITMKGEEEGKVRSEEERRNEGGG